MSTQNLEILETPEGRKHIVGLGNRFVDDIDRGPSLPCSSARLPTVEVHPIPEIDSTAESGGASYQYMD